MVVRVAVAVVVQADVLDLVGLVEDLVAVDRVDVADALVIAVDAMLALVA